MTLVFMLKTGFNLDYGCGKADLAKYPNLQTEPVLGQSHKQTIGVRRLHVSYDINSVTQPFHNVTPVYKSVSPKLTELLTLQGAVSAEPRDNRTAQTNIIH